MRKVAKNCTVSFTAYRSTHIKKGIVLFSNSHFWQFSLSSWAPPPSPKRARRVGGRADNFLESNYEVEPDWKKRKKRRRRRRLSRRRPTLLIRSFSCGCAARAPHRSALHKEDEKFFSVAAAIEAREQSQIIILLLFSLSSFLPSFLPVLIPSVVRLHRGFPFYLAYGIIIIIMITTLLPPMKEEKEEEDHFLGLCRCCPCCSRERGGGGGARAIVGDPDICKKEETRKRRRKRREDQSFFVLLRHYSSSVQQIDSLLCPEKKEEKRGNCWLCEQRWSYLVNAIEAADAAATLSKSEPD
jgi:hypothetical protein